VLILQLLLVARTGTDLPFQDQWDVEGRWLYPAWREGNLHATDLLRPHNEHRIVWTYGLDLVLFAANGQWDPLVQLAAGAVLRAAVAAGLAGLLVRGAGPAGRIWGMAGVALLFLPHLAWQNALWGFQSSVFPWRRSPCLVMRSDPAGASSGASRRRWRPSWRWAPDCSCQSRCWDLRECAQWKAGEFIDQPGGCWERRWD